MKANQYLILLGLSTYLLPQQRKSPSANVSHCPFQRAPSARPFHPQQHTAKRCEAERFKSFFLSVFVFPNWNATCFGKPLGFPASAASVDKQEMGGGGDTNGGGGWGSLKV